MPKPTNKQVTAYDQFHTRIMRMASTGDFAGAMENARSDATVKFNALHDTLFSLVTLQGNIASQEFVEAQSRFQTIFIVSIMAILVGVALAGYFGYLLLRVIMGPLDELNVRAKITDSTCIVSDSDLKGNILSVNKKYTEVSQYSRDELIGQPHSITRHPDMPKATFKKVWSTIGRGGVFRGVIKNRAKVDGIPG